MNTFEFQFCGETLHALGSGALFWPAQRLLAVSDLHLGKSERIARRSGQILPPYETIDTLTRLEDTITAHDPATVICLGDSFDDLAAGIEVLDAHLDWLTRLMAGRTWIWIEGNHDPGPLEVGGTHLTHLARGPLTFRHIAQDDAGTGEITGALPSQSSAEPARSLYFTTLFSSR